MTQAHANHQSEPDEEWPSLPGERALPLPSDAVPELDEEVLPAVPASDIPEVPDEPELPQATTQE